jgi:hypothetical protein
MALSRKKMLAMYFLLSTRSTFRAKLEGLNGPGPVATAADLLARFAATPPPTGMDASDMQAFADGAGPLGRLFVKAGMRGHQSLPQIGNVSIDPETIALAVGLAYDPSNPDCPSTTEGNKMAEIVIQYLP